MSDRRQVPHVLVLGGPNGAGKSTLAPVLLRDTLGVRTFVNADEIARGLSGFAPEAAAFRAGRLMLDRIDELTQDRASFAFESTLSGLRVRNVLARCRSAGYEVTIFYLWLASPDLALARVRGRVASGGHGIPEPDVRRRWARSLVSFLDTYRALASTWYVYDGGAPGGATAVAHGSVGGELTVMARGAWTLILDQADAVRRGARVR